MNDPIEFTKGNGSKIAIGKATIKFAFVEESQDQPNTRCVIYTSGTDFARVRESYDEVISLWKGTGRAGASGNEIR